MSRVALRPPSAPWKQIIKLWDSHLRIARQAKHAFPTKKTEQTNFRFCHFKHSLDLALRHVCFNFPLALRLATSTSRYLRSFLDAAETSSLVTRSTQIDLRAGMAALRVNTVGATPTGDPPTSTLSAPGSECGDMSVLPVSR